MTSSASSQTLPESFRDPSGFLFEKGGNLYRQINRKYRESYEKLAASGLMSFLQNNKLLIGHEDADPALAAGDEAFKIICPNRIPFISYPYEWCFSEFKDAALLTLRIQAVAMEYGMTLKDGSAYNIQFLNGKPVFIDTLSFEEYKQGSPWIAYRQFCQHFLAPLALMSRRDIRLNQELKLYIDGFPLDLAVKLLPLASKLNPGLLMHLVMHSMNQKKYAGQRLNRSTLSMSRTAHLGIIDNLESVIKGLQWNPSNTEWSDYYQTHSYSENAEEQKKRIVTEFIQKTAPMVLWDLGANDGTYSKIAGKVCAQVISLDIDPGAVEKNYLDCRSQGINNVLPLLSDLTNPAPGIGWENSERMSLEERGPADCVLALALVHHLAIANNLPLDRIARYFSKLCTWLIIEFVPKSDSQAQRLLVSREDIFYTYNRDCFEKSFKTRFEIIQTAEIKDTERVLYLMRKH